LRRRIRVVEHPESIPLDRIVPGWNGIIQLDDDMQFHRAVMDSEFVISVCGQIQALPQEVGLYLEVLPDKNKRCHNCGRWTDNSVILLIDLVMPGED